MIGDDVRIGPTIEALAHSLDIKFVRRSIERIELLVVEEIGLAGTLAELLLRSSKCARMTFLTSGISRGKAGDY